MKNCAVESHEKNGSSIRGKKYFLLIHNLARLSNDTPYHVLRIKRRVGKKICVRRVQKLLNVWFKQRFWGCRKKKSLNKKISKKLVAFVT